MSVEILDRLNAAGYFRSVVEMSPNALMVVSPKGTIAFINSSGAELFGYTVEELDDQPLGILIPNAHRAAHASQVTHYIQNPTVSPKRSEKTFSGLHKDGSILTLNIWLHPIPVEGQLYTFTSIVNNEAERKLARAQQQLWQAQKMEAIGQLASGIAHDFNNILTIINSCCYLAQLLLAPGSDAVQENLKEIEQAGSRAAQIVKQLLQFGSQDKSDTVILQCNDMLREVSGILEHLTDGIHLRLMLDPDLRPIVANKGQLEQIVVNLVVNARDAMPNGGTITISTGNTTLKDRDTPLPAGDYVRLSIQDTGTGIPEEIASRVFDPFFTTKEVGKGTGLGLFTAYGIVRQFNGHMQLATEMGVGTTFTCYFPSCQ